MGWIKQNDQTGTSATTSVATAAFASPLTPGSLIIVGAQLFGATGGHTFNTPTDTAGNTYLGTALPNSIVFASTNAIYAFYTVNTHSTANNVVSIGVTSASVTSLSINAMEFTGNDPNFTIDGGLGIALEYKSASSG